MYALPATLSDDIRYLGELIDEFIDGKIEPVKFKATRVPMGIYEQRKDGTFMVRIRCAGGFITPDQLKRVAEIAGEHQSDLIHITTRQELQIQNVTLKDAFLIIQKLEKTRLASKGGGGNTVRNILAAVNSGIESNEAFDISAYAFNLTTQLIAEPDSFTLPRKFKIAFSNSEADNGFAKFNDLGFIARIKDGKRGFNVYIGGGLASKPMVGYELFSFLPEEELFRVTKAAKNFFSIYGNRKNKHKARLRYVFYKLGKEEVFRLFFEIYEGLKKDTGLTYVHHEPQFTITSPGFAAIEDTSASFLNWKKQYATSQPQQGLQTIIVPFEHGNVSRNLLAGIATFAAAFGTDMIRFSVRQNIHLRNIPEAYLGNLYQLLLLLGVEVNRPLLENSLVSCTGADTCRLGICFSKGASHALKEKLSQSHLPFHLLKDIRINISGCPNSCGQQVAADIGFNGKVGRNDHMYPAYNVVVGATMGADAKLAESIGTVSAKDLPSFTTDVLQAFGEKAQQFSSSFSSYVAAGGKEDIQAILLKYATIPSFKDNDYYFDWGSDQPFSIASRGVGECSAGLFDMIDIDLNIVRKAINKIEKITAGDDINPLLYNILFSSSRMLLITRGKEPKTTEGVFNSFIERFIEADLIGTEYRDIIELARDNKQYDFTQKKEIILSLAHAVISLYESMDDSMKFKVKEKNVPLSIEVGNVS